MFIKSGKRRNAWGTNYSPGNQHIFPTSRLVGDVIVPWMVIEHDFISINKTKETL